MSEEKQKRLKLMAYWLFGTVMVVFGALSAFIAIWILPVGGGVWDVLKTGLPVWGVTALLAALFYAGYYMYLQRQEKV
ncbi:MAG: hypothetical protein ACLFTI_00930 [Anaerolineales bacterium]